MITLIWYLLKKFAKNNSFLYHFYYDDVILGGIFLVFSIWADTAIILISGLFLLNLLNK
jgi:hypothetical protein